MPPQLGFAEERDQESQLRVIQLLDVIRCDFEHDDDSFSSSILTALSHHAASDNARRSC